ncbi:MAG: C25 family cysteine peptidase [Verrucomicrobia bacterium]|nr:C25 family cysteine peptidase [Verrucomicrobiota bacterium]
MSDPATRASYVVIAPDAFADAAAAWAAYRDYPAGLLTAPLRSQVVRLEAIYDEFSDGLVTPLAIRSFLRRAHEQWAFKPRYALLVGDGTIDYRNLRGYGENLVPPCCFPTPYGLFVSDSQLGDIFDDGVPRVAIGRLPVHHAAELEPLLAKVAAYERRPAGWPQQALLVADRPDAAGDFIQAAADLALLLKPRYRGEVLHPLPYPGPGDSSALDLAAMQSALQTALNQGLDFLNYVGHGAVDRLGTPGQLPQGQPGRPSHVRARAPRPAARTAVPGHDLCRGTVREPRVCGSGGGAGATSPRGRHCVPRAFRVVAARRRDLVQPAVHRDSGAKFARPAGRCAAAVLCPIRTNRPPAHPALDLQPAGRPGVDAPPSTGPSLAQPLNPAR